MHQTVKKLCTGDAEAYIKWNNQLNQAITGKSCDTNKAKLEIFQMMLYGYLKDTAQEISESVRNSESTKDKVDKEVKQISVISARGYLSTAFCMALEKLKDQFFYKFAA